MPTLRAITAYTTPQGRRRIVPLYACWANLCQRAAPGFPDFGAFRVWALEAGYCRRRRFLVKRDLSRAHGRANSYFAAKPRHWRER